MKSLEFMELVNVFTKESTVLPIELYISVFQYAESESPIYSFKQILQSYLEVQRAKSKLKVYETVAGSSKFQVILICPGTSVTKAYVCVRNEKTNLVLVYYTRNTT